jgi:hypothetical protein
MKIIHADTDVTQTCTLTATDEAGPIFIHLTEN